MICQTFFCLQGSFFLKILWIKKMILILQRRLVHVLQLRVVWTRGHKYQFSFFIMWYIISALFLKASESEWDAGAGIWSGKEVNYQKKGPWILLPLKTSMITAMTPIMNTIQHKAYIALPIETIIEYKKSGIILFWFELCPKFNKKIDMSNVFLSKREFFWKFCGLRKCC